MPKIKLNGTEIYYEDHGPLHAPAIILSPLLYMDVSVYEEAVEAFSSDYRVIVYDHRGQGQSWPASKKTDLLTTTRDAVELIESLRLEPCHFVGGCLGAYVGLNLAIKRSDLLKSCTLIGATAEAETVETVKEMDRFLESMKKGGVRSAMISFANNHFGASFRASQDPIVVARREKIMQHLLNLSSDQLENARQLFHRPAISRKELQKISVPVLIIAGDEDQPKNVAAYKRLGEAISHVTYKTVQHAGYTVAIEQPQEVINLIRDHIEKAERAYSARINAVTKEKTKRHRL